MSAFTKTRRQASNSDNFAKRWRGSRNADDGTHVVSDDDLSNLLDGQKGRHANISEPRAPVRVRQDSRQPILRRARNLRTRNLDDDVATTDAELEVARNGASPSPDVHRASALSAANSKAGSQRGLLNLGTAAIVAVGLAGGLAASWGDVFGFRQTIAVENANDTHGAAIDQGPVPTPPTQASADSKLSDPATTASLPAPAADSAAPAAIPNGTPDAQTAQKSGTAESRDLGYPASALGEATQRLTSVFDGAPSVDHGSSPQIQKDELVDKEINPSGHRNSGACYVKVDGRVYVNGPCQIFRSKGQSLTLSLTDKTVALAFDHGRTWTATMGKRQLGKVFKRDSCWGNKQTYICEHAI
jgi:hypothetical protein